MTGGGEAARSRQRPWWLLALVLAALIAGGVGAYAKGTSELPVYLTGAERMLAGEPIYRPDDAKPFTYPPFFALPFVPLARLPQALQRGVWYALNVLALLFVLHVVSAAARLAAGRALRRGEWLVFWVLTLALAGRHLAAVLENQSHDLLVTAAVALAVRNWSRSREPAAGAWAGAGAALKATPLLYGLLFAVQRRVVPVLSLAAVAAGLTLLPDLLAPARDGRLWCVAWCETFLSGLRPGGTAAAAGAWNAGSFLNQSLSGTLHRLFTPLAEGAPFVQDVHLFDAGPGLRRVLTLGGQALVLLLLVVTSWPRALAGAEDRAWHRFGAAAAIGCGMVLLSPMSSKSHFAVLVLPTAWCVACLRWRGGDVVAWLLLAVAFVTGPLLMKGLVGRELGNTALAYGAVTAHALAVLLCTGHLLRRVARGAP